MKNSLKQQKSLIGFGQQISTIGLLVVAASLLILMLVHWLGISALAESGKHLFWLGAIACAVGAALWGTRET